MARDAWRVIFYRLGLNKMESGVGRWRRYFPGVGEGLRDWRMKQTCLPTTEHARADYNSMDKMEYEWEVAWVSSACMWEGTRVWMLLRYGISVTLLNILNRWPGINKRSSFSLSRIINFHFNPFKHPQPWAGETQKCAFSFFPFNQSRLPPKGFVFGLGCLFLSIRDNIFRKFSPFAYSGRGREKLTKGQFILLTLIKSYAPSCSIFQFIRNYFSFVVCLVWFLGVVCVLSRSFSNRVGTAFSEWK